MRNHNLKKILTLDKAFHEAAAKNDNATADALEAQIDILKPLLTPLEYYKFLKVQISHLANNTMEEIEYAIVSNSDNKTIASKIETAKVAIEHLARAINKNKTPEKRDDARNALIPSRELLAQANPLTHQPHLTVQ